MEKEELCAITRKSVQHVFPMPMTLWLVLICQHIVIKRVQLF